MIWPGNGRWRQPETGKESIFRREFCPAGNDSGENALYHVKPYPHIAETIRELSGQGVKNAVFSNKPHEAAVKVVETVFRQGIF